MTALTCRKCRVRLLEGDSKRACPKCGGSWHFEGGVLTSLAGPPGDQSGSSEAFFDRYHEQDGASSTSALPWWGLLGTLQPEQIIHHVVATTKPRVVVELGCGTGSNVVTVQSAHPGVSQLIGCDVSFQALTLARGTLETFPATPDLLLVHSDGDQLPLEPGFADLVLLINVLHHATDLSLVADAARIVRPGGTILIIDISSGNFLNNIARRVWNYLPSSLRWRFENDLLVRDEAPQVRLVNPVELDALARQHGLVLETHESKGLFLFTLQYLCILFPSLARRIPRAMWLGLAWLERHALSLPLLEVRGSGFSIRYRMVPVAPAGS